MSVVDGQVANASTFNAGLASKQADNVYTGNQHLNDADPASGAAIANLQREINSICSFMGKALATAFDDVPDWTPDEIGGSDDSIFQRADFLTSLFNSGTGHNHDGTSGQGAQIPYSSILGLADNNVHSVREETGEGEFLALDTSKPIIYFPNHEVGGVNIKGIDGGTEGKEITLINGAHDRQIWIRHNSSEVSAELRTFLPDGEDLVLGFYEGATFKWANARWRCVGRAVGGGGGGSGSALANLTVNEGQIAPTPDFSTGLKEWVFEQNGAQEIVLAVTVPDDLPAVNLEARLLLSAAAAGDVVFYTQTDVYGPLNSSRGVPEASSDEDTVVSVGTPDEMVEVALDVTQTLNDSLGEENVVGGRTLVITIRRPENVGDTAEGAIRIIEGSIRIKEVS